MQRRFLPLLEIPVVEHCNLNCKLCNAHAYLIDNSEYRFEQFKCDIDILSEYIHIGMITFMGGEPLLKDNLIDYIKYAKSRCIADTYRLLTNGILILNQSNILFELLDVIEVSIYPETKLKDRIKQKLSSLAKQCGFRYYIKEIHYFTDIDAIHLSEEEAQKGYEKCQRISNCLFNGMFYKCFRPKTTNLYLKEHGITINTDLRLTDGIVVNRILFAERLNDYLLNPRMLESCKYCMIGLTGRENRLTRMVSGFGAKHPALMRFYFRHQSLYTFYKCFKKLFNFDEGAHSKSSRNYRHVI